jgi:cardiolipin synthase
MFLQQWNLKGDMADYDKWLSMPGYEDEDAKGYVLPYCDTPLDHYKAGEAVYMDILYRATDYVHIMTPYLILDGELETALCFAAQRGVDVKLMLPGIPDKKLAYSLAKTHYKVLYDAGVKIYEYTPGFVHAKVFVSDDIKAVVGTINLDYRSLYHHFECATYMYKTDCVKDIEKDYQDTLEKCKEVSADDIKYEKFLYKLVGRLAKMISPLM